VVGLLPVKFTHENPEILDIFAIKPFSGGRLHIIVSAATFSTRFQNFSVLPAGFFNAF